MNIESYLNIGKQQVSPNRLEEIKKEQVAIDFEEIFAKHLVNELTKDSFKFADNGNNDTSNNLYREFVTDALASELAAQRRLGMADMIENFWNSTPDQNRTKPEVQNHDA
ncbi:MAG: hypothetical protein LAT84_07300 [Balneolia bacterium]|nr:hypothetical protein [Balneolia bacterium]